jgi:hypothetical protein
MVRLPIWPESWAMAGMSRPSMTSSVEPCQPVMPPLLP